MRYNPEMDQTSEVPAAPIANVAPDAVASVPVQARPNWTRIVGGILVAIIFIVPAIVELRAYFWSHDPNLIQDKAISTATTTTMENVIFNGEAFAMGDKLPDAQGTDYTSESYEWVRSTETLDTWTKLITTHKLKPLDAATPLDAAAYAQNVAALQKKNGALVLETSVINQDTEALGIDPANPPYLLVYMYVQGDATEFDMQKIEKQADGSLTSFIYAERFPTKSEADMKQYYESKERNDKRIELIKTKFPY